MNVFMVYKARSPFLQLAVREVHLMVPDIVSTVDGPYRPVDNLPTLSAEADSFGVAIGSQCVCSEKCHVHVMIRPVMCHSQGSNRHFVFLEMTS